MSKITYHREGDYLIPDLIVENYNKDYHIGKYGHLRLQYLKEHKRGLYAELMMFGNLPEHLADIDITANNRVKEIVKQMAEKENIPIHYDGKMSQLEWVGIMNNYKNRAEEIVFSELIYV